MSAPQATVFNVGDTAYLLGPLGIVIGNIYQITLTAVDGGGVAIQYSLNDTTKPIVPANTYTKLESQLFTTKALLIASL